ncbi:MAG: prepilin peptidase [Candidatus Pseudomonas phytovorans]|uniref:Prepilin peptidase n=1 Tax=Candidatus Pseudomonas phytovorans TaxID=3121377 RepID=A0AAJ5WDZ1_9PSED|nr:prepilin peptidase [Pseudomonas sp.]WEK29035.1 MAG: prepilin peptidase [Pseudomonas sp.]
MNSQLALIVLPPALCWVIASDLLYRRIHNLLVVMLALVWCAQPLFALLGLGPWGAMAGSELLEHLSGAVFGAVLVLIVGFMLFSIGQVGAGDVKLITVLCLWSSGNQMAFLVVTALAGGILALAMPLLAPLEQACAVLWQQVGARLPALGVGVPTVLTRERPQGLPYGLAIATGSFFTLFSSIHP